jgi:hypothetical protein
VSLLVSEPLSWADSPQPVRTDRMIRRDVSWWESRQPGWKAERRFDQHCIALRRREGVGMARLRTRDGEKGKRNGRRLRKEELIRSRPSSAVCTEVLPVQCRVRPRTRMRLNDDCSGNEKARHSGRAEGWLPVTQTARRCARGRTRLPCRPIGALVGPRASVRLSRRRCRSVLLRARCGEARASSLHHSACDSCMNGRDGRRIS